MIGDVASDPASALCELNYNDQTEATATRDGMGTVENVFDASARTIAAGVSYYGLNIEEND